MSETKTGDFACGHCEQRFQDRDTFLQHLKAEHLDQYEHQAAPPVATLVEPAVGANAGGKGQGGWAKGTASGSEESQDESRLQRVPGNADQDNG